MRSSLIAKEMEREFKDFIDGEIELRPVYLKALSPAETFILVCRVVSAAPDWAENKRLSL